MIGTRQSICGLGGLLVVSALVANAQPWSLETDTEWFVNGDFNGDGLLDIVVVDRTTGQYRVGWQKAPDNVGWSPAQPGGISDVEGATTGRLLNVGNDSLALAGALANRVHVLTPVESKLVAPTAVYSQAFGANQVVALDIGGGIGVAGYDDLIIATRLNNPPDRGALESRASTGGGFNLYEVFDSSGSRFWSGQGAQLRDGDAPVFVAMRRTGGDDGLIAWDYSTGVAVEAIPGVGGLTADTLVVAGRFAETFLASVLFYEQGQSTAAVWELAEDGLLDYSAGFVFDLNFPQPIGQLALLPDPSGNRLLFLAADGSVAGVYAFAGEPNPEMLQEFAPEGGDALTGILPLGDGHFMTVSGQNGVSTHFQTWLQNGDTYEAGPAGELPALDPNGARATILEFSKEPLIAARPGMTRSVAVGDWSATALLSGGPLELSSSIEEFAGSANGLDNPTPTVVGVAHPDTSFALPNQYRPEISFFQLFNARGDEVATVAVAPAGGHYPQAVQATLTAEPDTVLIGYRVGEGDNWKAFGGTPINIFTNTTLQYFSIAPGGARSPIQSAHYTFELGPDELDSDNDGVLDYVEIEEGLDPIRSGNDGDGDGFFDRDELVNGTDPTDPSSFPPAGHPRLEDLNWINLRVTPEPYDGTQPARTTSTPGANVWAYDGRGTLLGQGETDVLGIVGVPDPVAVLSVGVRPELPWITAVTDPHFDVVTPDADKSRGRELFRILPMPENDGVPVAAHTYDHTLSASANAAAWIADIQAAYASQQAVVVNQTLREDDVLIALLMERKLADIFLERGDDWATNLTIFPQRTADAGRRAPNAIELASLRHRVSPILPGYQLSEVFEHFETIVKSGVGGELDQLRLLVRDLYRISSELHNDNPGDYPSPIGVLRQFLADGTLDPAYATQTTITPGDQALAFNAVVNLLNNTPTRPYQTLQLVVRNDTFGGDCTLLDTIGGLPDTWALFHDGGEPYRELETFDLLPGVELQVSGYVDLGSAACGPNGMEVDTVSLQLVPAASNYDLDGNLLIDSWEQVFFGGAVNPFDDDDFDLFSNLQEMFEGSDPNDGLGIPGVAVESLAPPVLNIEILPNNDIRLTWSWPLAYANQVQVQMLSKPTLADDFDLTPLVPVHIGGDDFEVVVADPGAAAYFFQFALELND